MASFTRSPEFISTFFGLIFTIVFMSILSYSLNLMFVQIMKQFWILLLFAIISFGGMGFINRLIGQIQMKSSRMMYRMIFAIVCLIWSAMIFGLIILKSFAL